MVAEPDGARLYLVVESGPAAEARLAAALGAADVATVLIVPPQGKALEPAATKDLIELIQARGVAALIPDDARLTRTLKADGVHLTPSPAIAAGYAEAREILGTRYIVGCDVGHSRHDAMTIGEAGADYVAFSLPAEADAGAEDEQLDIVSWWNEIFEVPCVAFGARTAEDAGVQADAGADFVVLALASAASPADTAAVTLAYATVLGAAAPAAAAG